MRDATALARTDFDYASRCLQEGKLADAADVFGRIFTAHPDHSESVRHLGLIAHRIGNHDRAAELISQSILLNPECAEAFADLGAVFCKLGRYEYALKAIEAAIRMGHRTEQALTDLAQVLEALGRPAEAAQARRSASDARGGYDRPIPLDAPPAMKARSAAPQGWQVPHAWQKVQLVLIEPDGYPHMAALAELVSAFGHALSELGIPSEVLRNQVSGEGMNVVFGAHLINSRAIADALPANTVLINLEQLRGNKLEAGSIYADLMKRFAVWDHSQRNIAELRELTGNPLVYRIGIGFVHQMQHIAPVAEQPTDVLFYGSINDRRREILTALQRAGLKVRCLYGVYGAERDRAIAEAKVVVNIHFYEDSIHEIVRTSHLLANRKAVVCECNGDTEIDDDIRSAIAAVPYDGLVEACIALVRDDAQRHALEERGHELFARRSQAAMLAEAIIETSPPLPRGINLGSGKSWNERYLNVDVDPRWEPDLLADLGDAAWLDRAFVSPRLGVQRLSRDSFDLIVARGVLEHVRDLPAFMTSCLALLRCGGKMMVSVPYDLSYGAWQDPKHVRSFNERSWLHYTDWHWHLGWTEARFDLQSLEMVLSPLGQSLAQKLPPDELHRQPRAVDGMKAVLVKRLLTEHERTVACNFLKSGRRSA